MPEITASCGASRVRQARRLTWQPNAIPHPCSLTKTSPWQRVGMRLLEGDTTRSFRLSARFTASRPPRHHRGTSARYGVAASASQNSALSDTELWSVSSITRSVATPGRKARSNASVSLNGTSSS